MVASVYSCIFVSQLKLLNLNELVAVEAASSDGSKYDGNHETQESTDACHFGKRYISRRSQRNALVRVSLIWENNDQEHNVYELGFISVDQLVPPECSVS
ncbi:hypothetical protein QYE76_041766 [Lolium multiflorum]|uniref:Uncharacterized protein n=1 Tax=Lolium multiflorum TaxID=4521 RepID=A0AAD8TFY0_LOLMU|nr:hypothetical protein QYE76_041766 [Lolium multiflorum]